MLHFYQAIIQSLFEYYIGAVCANLCPLLKIFRFVLLSIVNEKTLKFNFTPLDGALKYL